MYWILGVSRIISVYDNLVGFVVLFAGAAHCFDQRVALQGRGAGAGSMRPAVKFQGPVATLHSQRGPGTILVSSRSRPNTRRTKDESPHLCGDLGVVVLTTEFSCKRNPASILDHSSIFILFLHEIALYVPIRALKSSHDTCSCRSGF